MIISKNWLNEIIDLSNFSTEQICAKLNSIGLEVDSVTNITIPDNIVVGYVKSCVKHENSDHLHVCEVDVAVIDEGNEYTGLSVNGDLNITGGTYRITAESYGIKVADDKKLTVNNATIIAKASAGGAIYLTGTSASCQVYGIVNAAYKCPSNTLAPQFSQ